ncbi:MAG TPA: glycosyltransferase family 4 protein [Solirubrobacteraceae bacterium]|nr:glycosyltransferase family 4 protein [Solirubrobacteraceae bacterium]
MTPLWTRYGGVATHVQASAAALARHGVAVNVLAARVDSGESVPGVTVHHNPELLSSEASMNQRIDQAMSSQPEVIHLHQVDDPEMVKAMRRQAPVVISAHGYTACPSGVYYFRPGRECTRSHGPGCIPNLVIRGCAHMRDPRPLPLAYRRAGRGLQALKAADLAVAYSTSVERHLAANEVTRRRIVPLFTTMVAKTGSGHAGRRRVVFAGRVVAAKGVAVLIRAAREVEGEFVICGEGWQLEAMRRLSRRLGLEGRVRFPGWLPAEDLAQELADASVVVMPSLWPEPFGLVGIEALSAGRPVIASATGGVGDWLEDGVGGLCVPPGDAPALARALDELLADPDRQRAMGAAGRETVAARLTAERHVAALLDAYASARARWESDVESG